MRWPFDAFLTCFVVLHSLFPFIRLCDIIIIIESCFFINVYFFSSRFFPNFLLPDPKITSRMNFCLLLLLFRHLHVSLTPVLAFVVSSRRWWLPLGVHPTARPDLRAHCMSPWASSIFTNSVSPASLRAFWPALRPDFPSAMWFRNELLHSRVILRRTHSPDVRTPMISTKGNRRTRNGRSDLAVPKESERVAKTNKKMRNN